MGGRSYGHRHAGVHLRGAAVRRHVVRGIGRRRSRVRGDRLAASKETQRCEDWESVASNHIVTRGGGDQIFTEHMLASRNANARAALEDVQEKHKDIQRLESSIQELHQLFVDLSVLVESQGLKRTK